jgi:hypothetical protein
MVGIDAEAWRRAWMNPFGPRSDLWRAMPATLPIAANDEVEAAPLPEGEPVPPNFA